MSHPSVPKDLAKERTEERARALAEAVVEAFTHKLRTEIDKHGGFLGLRHVADIEAELQAKGRQLSVLFAQAFDDAAREQEELRWHAIKRPAFDRLVVKRFEHLLIHRGPDGNLHGLLSRRMLPGFFLALNMMLGPEILSDFQHRADAAVERVMKGKVPVDWDRVDADRDVGKLLLDAQYIMALYFEDTQHRFTWLMHICNSHLAESTGGPDANWEMGHRATHMMVAAMLSDLQAVVEDDDAWTMFAVRHPDAERTRLKTILKRLN